MSPSTPVRAETILYEWVRLLLGQLTRLGLRDVVICPGSRNAPLILGALDDPLLRCHSVIDERTAGFFALGLARSQECPVALLCTSGSALAHFFPAVIEAHQAGIPLLVLSADRPSYLQDCGAAQTIDQVNFFGSFARYIVGWDEPSAEPKRLRHFARKVRQTWELSLAGPAHLNLPLDKPLEPLPPSSIAEGALHDRVSALLEDTWSPQLQPSVPPTERLIEFVDQFSADQAQGLLVIGPVEPQLAAKAQELAGLLGLPIVTELPGVQKQPVSVERLALSLSQGVGTTKLLHIGPPLTSAAWGRLVESSDLRQYVLCGSHYQDQSGLAKAVFATNLTLALSGICSHLFAVCTPLSRRPFDLETTDADRKLLHAALESSAGRGGLLNEPAAVLAVLNSAQASRSILLGNSLSVRLSAWVAPLVSEREWNVFLTRGANGIDGHIAQAAGLARGSGQPVLALIGDVAAAHDIGALQAARELGTSLVIVVLDNGGGRIFERLPGARLWPSHPTAADYFLTPPKLEWESLGRGFGVKVTTCTDLKTLGAVIERAVGEPKTHLVIAKTDPETTSSFLATLQDGRTTA